MMFGKGGWIENHQVESVFAFPEVFKCIAGKGFMFHPCWKVELHVLIRQFCGFWGTIDRNHRFTSSGSCIDRKATCIAKQVQHIGILGIMLQELTVLPLIDVEARFLTLCPVYTEGQAILLHRIICSESQQISFFPVYISFMRQGSSAFVIDRLEAAAQQFP